MSVTSRRRLLAKLKNKAYRDAYTAEHVKTTTPLQIRTVREQREWTQGKLATGAKTTQTAISRTEDPNYGNLTLNNLLKIAAALDVGLLVKLVPFSRLVKEYEDLSPQAMAAPSFIEELSALEAWADDMPNTSADDSVSHKRIAVPDILLVDVTESTRLVWRVQATNEPSLAQRKQDTSYPIQAQGVGEPPDRWAPVPPEASLNDLKNAVIGRENTTGDTPHAA